jgi:protein-disulfide isomerase
MSYWKAILPLMLICALVAGASTSTDLEALRPPKGSKVALVVFEDLECPTCGQVHPQLEALSKQYNVPLVIHDFPLNIHAWAMPAAILARYFESRKPGLGREFRIYIFANQQQISAPCDAKPGDPSAAEQCRQNLRTYAQRFAAEKKTSIPFALDPGGAIESAIQTDVSLGRRVGVQHTPTIYIMTNRMTTIPPETPIPQLQSALEQVVAQEGSNSAPAATKTSAHKSGKKK